MKKILCILMVILIYGMSTTKKSDNVKTIVLQPYFGFPKTYVEYVKNNLLLIYPKVIVLKDIPLPKQAFVNNRNRADSLLKYLEINCLNNTTIVGMTNKDITTQNGKISDWGIFGLSNMPGKVCVISSFRIKGNVLDKIFKTVIHELGHTEGLNHCSIPGCIMSDAKGKDNFNNEDNFCNKCKNYLIKRNWKL